MERETQRHPSLLAIFRSVNRTAASDLMVLVRRGHSTRIWQLMTAPWGRTLVQNPTPELCGVGAERSMNQEE